MADTVGYPSGLKNPRGQKTDSSFPDYFAAISIGTATSVFASVPVFVS